MITASISGKSPIVIAAATTRLGPAQLTGEARSENCGSVRIFRPFNWIRKVACPIQVKLVETPAGWALYPEYEDCRRVALENNVPLKDVFAAVNHCTPENFISEE